jgi:integrase
MAALTGLFQRGTSYYLRVVLPSDHPLQSRYRNGCLVTSLGRCTYRDAVLQGTIKRAEVLAQRSIAFLPASALTPPVSTMAFNRPLLRDIYDRWKVSKPRSPDAISACLRSVALCEQFTGNPPISELTREQGDGFRSWLQQPDRKTTSKTARDRLIWVKSILKFAALDLGLIHRNPWEGLDIDFKTTNKRRPWSDAELRTLFNQDLHMLYTFPADKKAGADAAYWIPLLGLFTGARIGELAQLHVSDVEHDGEVPLLSITDEGEGRSVKSQAGVRKVPVHSELVRLGFMDYASTMRERKETLMWPLLARREGKPGGYFSHWFGMYRRSLGFGMYPDFHCFRHTVRSKLADAEVPEQVMDTIVGHEIKGSTGAKVYTHRSIKVLKSAVEALNYPALLLPRVFDPNTPRSIG